MIVFYQKRHHAFSYMIPFIFPTALQYYTILCSASYPKPQFLFYSFRLSASYPASVSDSPCVSGYRKLSPSGKCSCSCLSVLLETDKIYPFSSSRFSRPVTVGFLRFNLFQCPSVSLLLSHSRTDNPVLHTVMR